MSEKKPEIKKSTYIMAVGCFLAAVVSLIVFMLGLN
tara:strand:- start:1198 stop:1305 length:108 start_codon:yes stop_codon:yes gene_type:complete